MMGRLAGGHDVFSLVPPPPIPEDMASAARRTAAQQVIDGKLTIPELREILEMLDLAEGRQP